MQIPPLKIVGAKPKPLGSSITQHHHNPAKLLAEFADIKNVGSHNVSLEGIRLANTTFDHDGKPHKIRVYWTGSNLTVLSPGQVVRVHTGKSKDAALMHPEDRNGADHHAYAESGDFILNDKEGDKLYLYASSNEPFDSAYYKPNPPAGSYLVRRGDELVLLSAEGALASIPPITSNKKPVLGHSGRAA